VEATGQVLTGGAIDARNAFDNKAAVMPATLDVRLARGGFRSSLPPRSVSVMTLTR
jgi:alpha-L-arabinofuranosidase